MNVHIIASGSKGNATLIYDEKTSILIDCGITKKRLKEGLKEINKKIDDIDFAFFTHNHTDHIKGERFIGNNKKYSLKGTLPINEKNILELYKSYQFNTFNVTILKTEHDAIASCGFLIKNNHEELVYITDTGIISEQTLNLIRNKDYYIFESNYDIEMLLLSNRSTSLKTRILSHYGHLSNEDCAFYLNNIVGNNTKKIILAHISEECNDKNIALNTIKNYFYKENNYSIDIKCAYQNKSVDL